MVVGNGMMAEAFSTFRDNNRVVIFASGVSNSLEKDPVAFIREKNLLLRTHEENAEKLLVYFGTCSVDDPDRRDTPYVRHKLEMEELLANSAGSWMVLRLPLAIGPGHRGPTLAQYLYERISRGEPFDIWAKTTRYPIDVIDVFSIASRFIADRSLWNRRINVAFRAFPILDFVRAMEQIVGKSANCTLVQKGQPYEISCPEVSTLAGQLDLDFSDQYLHKVLARYFGTR